MWEVKIGEIIKKKREKLGIRQADLCGGICTVSTLSKIENGLMFPTSFKLRYLMERLGIDTDQYFILSSGREIELNNVLEELNNSFKTEPKSTGETLKKAYDLMNEDNAAERQTVGAYSLRNDILEQKKPFETIAGEALELLRITHPDMSSEPTEKSLYSKTEWNILMDYGKTLVLIGDKERALEVLLKVRQYLARKYMDYELIREGYETATLGIVEILISFGRFVEADTYSDELIDAFSKNKGMANLAEVMINRTIIAINLKKSPDCVRQMIKQTREVIKMDKGIETAERFDDYIRKECGHL